jgi:hypothetical protein
MTRKEHVLREQNEFLKSFIASLEDVKAGRVKEVKLR